MTAPFGPVATLAFSSARPAVFGTRPMAKKTRSAVISLPSLRWSVRAEPAASSCVVCVLGCSGIPPAGEGFGEPLAQVLVEAAQGQLAAIDEVRLGAEAGEDAGELHRDIAEPTIATRRGISGR